MTRFGPGDRQGRARALPSGVDRRVEVALVGALTVLALILRLRGFRDSLYGDELLLYRIVHDYGLADAFQVVHDTEKTPPLHFALARAAARVGDPTVWLRGPSLVLGTATVPLVYALGRRTVGRAAAAVGAAIIALDPFAIFYSTEARAYATVAFLVALSTLALVTALDRRRRGWWVLYGLATLAVLYTHYVAALVVVVQAVWAFWTHREQLRELIVVHAAVCIGYLPWLPGALVQYGHSDEEAKRIVGSAPFTLERLANIELHAFMGHPYLDLARLPGRFAVALALVTIAVAAAVAVVRQIRSRRPLQVSTPVMLLALLALATPVGVGLYSLQPDTSFMLARNMSPSLPALALVTAWLLISLGRRAGLVASLLVLAALAIGTVRLLDVDNRRPPLREAADFVAARAQPGDPVINYFTWVQAPHVFATYLGPDLRLFAPGGDDAAPWRLARRTGRIFLVVPRAGPFAGVRRVGRRAGPGKRFLRVEDRVYPGFTPILVGEYRPARAPSR